MKYIKTYESFNVTTNVTTTFAVEGFASDVWSEYKKMGSLFADTIEGSVDLYKDIFKDIVEYFGDKYDEFTSKLKEIIDGIFIKLGIDKIKNAIKAAERYFGKPLSEINYELVKNKIQGKIQSSIKNESFGDTYDKTEYDGQPMDSLHRLNSIKGGFIQQLGQLLQDIFVINTLSFGYLTSYILDLIIGTDALSKIAGPGGVLLLGIAGWVIVHILRKLDMMYTNWVNK